jgi:DNA-binding MarR family transcriptional regulator
LIVANDRFSRLAEAYEQLMLRAASLHATELVELDLTMSQVKALYVTRVAGELRMSELANQLGVGVSTVSALVDRLVEQGLLTRVADPQDRRQVHVRITPTGSARLERLRELSATQLRSLLAALSESELDIVEDALRILTLASERLPT